MTPESPAPSARLPHPDVLAARFVSRQLTPAEWTHEAHLVVGLWHVHRYGAEDALLRLRSGIRALNDAHGTPNSTTRGYHETITAAYVRLIDRHLAACPADASIESCAAALLASPLGARDALLRFYTRGRLMSIEARAGWVDPDLSPLSP